MDTPTKPIVLVAEDEALVAMTIEDILTDAGFDFVFVRTARDVIKILEEKPDQFCALLTDIRMPGELDGWDAARHARELRPLLPVVYMTGDSAAAWRAHGVPGSVLLQKPFAEAQLVTALATLLNEANSPSES